jgi:anti-sigma factor RsiW
MSDLTDEIEELEDKVEELESQAYQLELDLACEEGRHLETKEALALQTKERERLDTLLRATLAALLDGHPLDQAEAEQKIVNRIQSWVQRPRRSRERSQGTVELLARKVPEV